MAALTNPPPPPSSVATRVSRENAEKAVEALLSWRKTKSESEKPQLLEEDEFLYLILSLKKIPPKERINPYKIPLPHPLHAADSTELCLIMDDRPKSNLSKQDAKKKIKAENIPVSKVIKLTKLRSDYKPFEAKRKLCHSYDMFFADRGIIPLLPKLLGKPFFKNKKIPVSVNLGHKNWKEQIERACGSAMLFVRTGTCSVLKVGRVSMGKEEMVDNLMAAIEGVAEVVPHQWGNVRSFNVRLQDSLALPLYQAVPDVKLKIDGLRAKEEEVKVGGDEEVAEKSKGGKDEKVGKKKALKKGRIHEVKYMDMSDEAELSDGDDGDLEMGDADEGDQIASGGKKSKKESKGKPEETGHASLKKAAKAKKDEVGDDDLVTSKEVASKEKKRKKEGIVKSKENDEPLLKKSTKAKKDETATKGGEESGSKKENKDAVKTKKGGLAVKGKEESDGKKEKRKSSTMKSESVEMKVKGGKTKKRSLAA